MSRETFYFSHDYNARNDPKLQKVLMKLGQEGKGVYWDLIEMLYEQGGYLLLSDCDSYAFQLRTQCDCITKLINGDFELFKKDDEKFWSESVLKRLSIRDDKSNKARQSAFARWNDANAMRTQSDGNAIKERKGKENKENKRIGKKNKFIPPTIDEVKLFFKEAGYSQECAINAFEYYDDLDWHDKNDNPVLNWKMKMRTVWFRDEHKLQEQTDFSPLNDILKTLKK